MTEHPITPPPELIQTWWEGDNGALDEFDEVIKQAVRWGADRELEACCAWLKAKEWIHPEFSDELRAARRPKLPSLGKTAIAALETIEEDLMGGDEAHPNDLVAIRRALERLQELEGQGDG